MISGIGTLALLISVFSFYAYLRGALRAPRFGAFERAAAPPLETWPSLSVVIAARDEAASIEAALKSLFAQDYPALEIVVVDDRSADGTGEILDRIAASEPRLRVVHVSELPEGWLGKVHALARGVEPATGEWLLFTDADVYFAPGALKRAVSIAAAGGLDHLTLLPVQHTRGFLAAAIEQAAVGLLVAASRPSEIDREGSRRFLGIGAFNLVRRSVFDRTPGFEWLRLEVLDDMGLALMMRHAGGRPRALFSTGDVSLEWYERPFVGLEKVFLAGANYSPAKLFLQAAGLVLLAAAPFIAVLPIFDAYVRVAGAAALVMIVVRAWVVAGTGRGTFLRGVFEPPAQIILALAMLRAALIGAIRGDLRWRGSKYEFGPLRAGRRLPAGKLRA